MTERLKRDTASNEAIWGGVAEQIISEHIARTRVTIGPELNEEDKVILRGHMGFLSDAEFDAFVDMAEDPPSTPAEVVQAHGPRPISLASIMRDMQ